MANTASVRIKIKKEIDKLPTYFLKQFIPIYWNLIQKNGLQKHQICIRLY